jgi:hypothetical protein
VLGWRLPYIRAKGATIVVLKVELCIRLRFVLFKPKVINDVRVRKLLQDVMLTE